MTQSTQKDAYKLYASTTHFTWGNWAPVDYGIGGGLGTQPSVDTEGWDDDSTFFSWFGGFKK